jgi:cytidylate kinase
MIITIDGPAGAGKSSTARLLAQRLGFEFLDTGAMYRAVALAALEMGLDLQDQDAIAHLLAGLYLELPPGRVLLNGTDVSQRIRTAEVTAASGPIASSRVVRERLVQWQRAIADNRDMVCEGRDQGTVVFPHAECKFFLVADPVERARRRHHEMLARGEQTDLADVLRAQEARDRRDADRDLAPMRPAADAILLDSTHLNLDQIVDRMENEARRCTTGSLMSSTKPPTSPPCP